MCPMAQFNIFALLGEQTDSKISDEAPSDDSSKLNESFSTDDSNDQGTVS